MRMVMGIDPGQKGGIAFVTYEGRLEKVLTMPMEYALYEALADSGSRWSITAFMEKAQSMPGNKASAMFSYGRHNGFIEGVLTSLKIPLTLVPPKTWIRVMHAGTRAGMTKARSIEAATRLFPQWSFIAAGAKKPHDGMVEASLIAEYGRRTLIGNLSNVS